MHKRLVEILQAALGRFWSHVQLVGLDKTDESTFRSFVLAEIHRQLPRCRCHADGRCIDLLVQLDKCNVLLKFQFYTRKIAVRIDDTGNTRSQHVHDGAQGDSALSIDSPIHEKYIIVAYPRDGVWAGRPTFRTSDTNVQMIGAVLHVTEIPHGHQNRLACLLLCVQ